MSFGIFSPLPMQVGGGPTKVEEVYETLRKALGKDGAGPQGGLEDTWRAAKATVIARALIAKEVAACQAFPHLASEYVELYEEMLGVPAADTLAERLEAVQSAYTSQLSAVLPSLLEALRAIDPAIEIDHLTGEEAVVAKYGKPFGASWSSPWPAFSQHHVCYVRLPLTDGGWPEAKLAQLRRVLNRVLPAWCDWQIANRVGFYLDGFNDSYLDTTAMSES